MRKIIVILLVILGVGEIYAFNVNSNSEEKSKDASSVIIEIDELPSTIQEILFYEFKDYIVKSVETKRINGNCVYEITLIDSENYEYTIYINDKGVILE